MKFNVTGMQQSTVCSSHQHFYTWLQDGAYVMATCGEAISTRQILLYCLYHKNCRSCRSTSLDFVSESTLVTKVKL